MGMAPWQRRTWLGLAAIGLLALAGCGTTTPASLPPVKPVVPISAAAALQTEDSAHRVTLTIAAGVGNGGFNLNGYRNGALTIRVPVGWTVTVHFENRSPLANSLAVVTDAGATSPAFAGAGLPAKQLHTGLSRGTSATFSFVAARPGTYRLASLVAGHEESGQWVRFLVTPGGQPAYGPTR
jgi:predicted small lipoprotein YifL